MRLKDCHNFHDFRNLAKRRLPGPIFNYIDGGADDETTMRRAAEIGCTGIVLSNHGGRQLDGSRTPFDQLDEIVQAVGDKLDVMMDSGIQRGTHVLKALSFGVKAVGIGRGYLYALAAGGQPAVERALGLMQAEIERDMKLMGVTRVDQLSRDNLWFLDEGQVPPATRKVAA